MRKAGTWKLIGVETGFNVAELAKFSTIRSLETSPERLSFRDEQFRKTPIDIESVSHLPDLRDLSVCADDLLPALRNEHARYESIESLDVAANAQGIVLLGRRLSAFSKSQNA